MTSSPPTVEEQAMNLIRYIGDEVSKSGQPIELHSVPEELGIPNYGSLLFLFKELVDKSLVQGNSYKYSEGETFSDVTLTPKGWDKYKGRSDDNYGFLAMKFNEPDLETFVQQVLKPAVKDSGFDLVDMRDVARAGIIDNILRAQIKGAKFIIADLTYDNCGAYWEAGYAEGLCKPVIYICEKEKFESDDGTHFDTNHCTTIAWSIDDDVGFRKQLSAILSRSLLGAQ